jgi:DnaJ-class molecular chaperone
MDLYNILNLNKNCTKNDIKKAYRKLVLLYHPDKNKNIVSSEQFIKLKYAYDILSNEESRAKYDNSIDNNNNNNYILSRMQNFFMKFYNIDNSSDIINLVKYKFINFIKSDMIFNDNFNFYDNLKTITLLNINIQLNFTLKDYWNNKPILLNQKRFTKDNFIEYIYPIDFKQIYENEGEIIKINDLTYNGNFIININIIDNIYNNIDYIILNHDLYAKINIKNTKYIEFKYFDDNNYKFKLNKYLTNCDKICKINNFGLPFYNTNENIIDISKENIDRGDLYIILP